MAFIGLMARFVCFLTIRQSSIDDAAPTLLDIHRAVFCALKS